MSRPSISPAGIFLLLCLAVSAVPSRALAATPDDNGVETASALPDSPGSLRASSGEDSSSNPAAAAAGQALGSSTKQPAPQAYVKLIAAGLQAPPQTASDKIRLGLRESVTPFAIIGWPLSAGWSHLINGSPNYGVNGEAFAQRLGAAAALNSSKEVFSDSILATAFHQDPRYYQLGRGHKLFNRALYAGTRPIIGRTDSGKTIPNYAFILGTGGAAALTQTYYPDRNVSGGQFARTWVTSLGGSALGYLVSEFGGEVIQKLRVINK
jgi:hypothetical protein